MSTIKKLIEGNGTKVKFKISAKVHHYDFTICSPNLHLEDFKNVID